MTAKHSNNSISSLAIFGGAPVRSDTFPPWPYFPEDVIQTASETLRSGKVNQWTGKEVFSFGDEFATIHGRRYGISLSNGTVALELALRALGIGPDDEVITTARTFFASASAIVAVGATPILADVAKESGNLTVQTIEAAITSRTRAVIPVHVGGWPCDMKGITALARMHNLFVLEDCAQALGAEVQGRPVGAWGDIGVFSFCQDKHITTGGEGGCLICDDEEIWERAWSYKDHGKSFMKCFSTAHPPGFRWLHDSWGSNYRMTEMQAAMGRRLMSRWASPWLLTRRKIGQSLEAHLSKLPALEVPIPPVDTLHSYYRLYVKVKEQALASGWSRDRIMNAISAEGVPCLSGSCCEVYREKAFSTLPLPSSVRSHARLPGCAALAETSLSFLVHPTIADKDLNDIKSATEKVLTAAHTFAFPESKV